MNVAPDLGDSGVRLPIDHSQNIVVGRENLCHGHLRPLVLSFTLHSDQCALASLIPCRGVCEIAKVQQICLVPCKAKCRPDIILCWILVFPCLICTMESQRSGPTIWPNNSPSKVHEHADRRCGI